MYCTSRVSRVSSGTSTSTMKIILLYVLFNLCMKAQAGNSTSCPKPASPDDPTECLIQAIKVNAEHELLIGHFVCDYYQYKLDDNVERYREATRVYGEALKCLGCRMDQLFGTAFIFEDVLENIEKLDAMGEYAIKFAEKFGLDGAGTKAYCILLGHIMKTECMQAAIGESLPGFVKDLKDLYCKLQEEKATNASSKLASLLKQLECTPKENLNLTGGNTTENIVQRFSDTQVKDVAEKLLITTQTFPVVDKTLCTVITDKNIMDIIK